MNLNEDDELDNFNFGDSRSLDFKSVSNSSQAEFLAQENQIKAGDSLFEGDAHEYNLEEADITDPIPAKKVSRKQTGFVKHMKTISDDGNLDAEKLDEVLDQPLKVTLLGRTLSNEEPSLEIKSPED